MRDAFKEVRELGNNVRGEKDVNHISQRGWDTKRTYRSKHDG